MNQLQPHQQRVVVERDELQDKLTKLQAFTQSEKFTDVVKCQAERARLLKQQEIMLQYINVLNERISCF